MIIFFSILAAIMITILLIVIAGRTGLLHPVPSIEKRTYERRAFMRRESDRRYDEKLDLFDRRSNDNDRRSDERRWEERRITENG